MTAADRAFLELITSTAVSGSCLLSGLQETSPRLKRDPTGRSLSLCRRRGDKSSILSPEFHPDFDEGILRRRCYLLRQLGSCYGGHAPLSPACSGLLPICIFLRRSFPHPLTTSRGIVGVPHEPRNQFRQLRATRVLPDSTTLFRVVRERLRSFGLL